MIASIFAIEVRMRTLILSVLLTITLLASPFAQAITVPGNKAVQQTDGTVQKVNNGRMLVEVDNGGVKMVIRIDTNSRVTIDGKPGRINKGDFVLYICAEMTASRQPLTLQGRRSFTVMDTAGTFVIMDKAGNEYLFRMAKSADIDIEGYGKVSFATLNRIYDRVPNPPDEVTCVYFVLGKDRYCTQFTDRRKRK